MAIIFSKIGIIGGGISGLAAAKHLSEYNPVVLEATDSIGGVWKHCSFRTTKLQTPRCDYEFSDYPWPLRDNTSFPTYIEILDYLNSYANHFDLFKFIKFNSRVTQIKLADNQPSKVGNGFLSENKPVWEVAVQTNGSPDHIQWYGFEFIVVCMGKYGDVPIIPNYGMNKGPDVFKGKVMHSQEYSKLNADESSQLLKGKKVVVVGYKKSGIDLAVECAEANQDVPIIPNYGMNKGPDVFKGKVMHSQEYSKLNADESSQLLKGKKVVVVGYKKSGIDLAVECAEANQGEEGKACTMVVRTSHWTVPHYSIWGLPFYLFYSTRFSQFLHQTPNQGTIRTLLCHLLSPARKAASKFIESYLLWKLPLVKYGLKPDHPFEEDYASCQMAILPHNFFHEADKGKINFKRASKWWFWEGGVEFEDNTKLEADVVLLATGYDGKKKLRSVLPEPFSSFLEFPSGMMPLYRGTINPYIPNMAFMGYVESVSNLHTSEIRCKWLARLIGGKFKLPSNEKMVEQITTEMELMKKTTRFYKRTCISTFSINHSDQICEEMGWNSWRKKSWLAEAFSPYNSRDYEEED